MDTHPCPGTRAVHARIPPFKGFMESSSGQQRQSESFDGFGEAPYPPKFSPNLPSVRLGTGLLLGARHLHEQTRTICESEHRVRVALVLAGDVSGFSQGKHGACRDRILRPRSRVQSRSGRA
jgi:hypothetical protein